MATTINNTAKKNNGNNGDTFRQFFIDDSGKNKMLFKVNDKLVIITLLLKGSKPRRIGRVTRSTNTLEVVRKRDKHLFIKGNAYGFNYSVISKKSGIDWVSLSDDTGAYWKIPAKFILENGSFLHFLQKGFERQIFLSLEKLEQFKIKDNSRW